MRLTVWMLLLALVPALGVQAQDKAAPPKGDVTQYTFDKSKVFPGTTRSFWVYVPKQYDPAKPACVHVNQDGVQFNAPAVFDQLIAAKEMPVTIGVFLNPGNIPPSDKEAKARSNRSFEYDSLGDLNARFFIDEIAAVGRRAQHLIRRRIPQKQTQAGRQRVSVQALLAGLQTLPVVHQRIPVVHP